MQYRIKETGEIVSQGDVRRIHADKSLPAVFNADTCEFLGIDPVLESPVPEVQELEVAALVGAEQDAKGNWVQKYEVRPMFSDIEVDGKIVTKLEQETTYLERKSDERAKQVRAERDRLLAETDWLVIRANEGGPAMTEAQKEYRKALRDVTEQEGFPLAVEWPVKP